MVQYRDCGTLLLPVNADANLSLLDKFLNPDVNASNADRIAQDLLDGLSKNPDWKLLFPQLDVPDKLKDIINTNFLELLQIPIFHSLLLFCLFQNSYLQLIFFIFIMFKH